MAKNRKVEAGAINIRTQPPHKTTKYVSLMEAIYELRTNISSSRSNQSLLLSSLSALRKDGDIEYLSGSIARFTDIDINQKWFNIKTNDTANQRDVASVNIPSHLRPNYKSFAFRFFPQRHLFVFEKNGDGSSISHGAVAAFLEKLFLEEAIQEKFGEINIDIVSDKDSLEDIYKIPYLKHLEIVIKRPNPDLLSEREILKRLEALGANKVEERYTAPRGGTIIPDNTIKKLAVAALTNGAVHADGTDLNGKKVEISTTKHPRTERKYYTPTAQSDMDAFHELAKEML